MADRETDILLIGGGIASATAAATLREEGFDGSILLVGRELDPPYHRPPVSKGYLRGHESKDDTLVHPAGWWEEQGVELRTRTSVMALDPAARTATLQSKEEVAFGHALVATGAMVRRLSVDGAQLDGIHYLRALGNADTLRRDVEDAERVVCVGGSYIGSEVAASLTELGKRVTILMQEAHPLERQFGARAAARFRAVLEAHGIEIVGDDEVERFEAAAEGVCDAGRVARVVTKGGRALEAGAVVCGVGAQPDVMLARKSGLALGELSGVKCDSRLRTSAERVFAAGDMCEFDSVVHGRVMRIEHEEVAAAQGATAARSMLGADAPHDVVPYFFSDLSDWAAIEYVGPALRWDEEVVRGDIDSGPFAVWYLEDGRVRGMLSVDGRGDVDAARELVAAGEAVGAAGVPG
ncbi:MAG: 3-phenylpropionate/trans-cinnamate dioxygenase ferredoxin reductase component [Solirubrobacteraceae bacterium]|nr:3-phenylpropionate/trans-cinnamate dioxygenase ferredoxin reductase component [Solirubrobacteraceae bacterium]